MPTFVLALLLALAAAMLLAVLIVRVVGSADRVWGWPAAFLALVEPLAVASALGAVRSHADVLFFLLVGMALAAVVGWVMALNRPDDDQPPPDEPRLRSTPGPTDEWARGDVIGGLAGQGLVLAAGRDPSLAFDIQLILRAVLDREADGSVIRQRPDGLELKRHGSATTGVYVAFVTGREGQVYVWAGGGFGDTGLAFGGFGDVPATGEGLDPTHLPAATERTVRSSLIPDIDVTHDVAGFFAAHRASTPDAVELDGTLHSARVSDHAVVVGCHYPALRLFVALQVVEVELALGGGEDLVAILSGLTVQSLRAAVELDELAEFVVQHLGPPSG